MFETLPWLPMVAKPGRTVGVTTADDDTTNPPEMQAWVLSKIRGAKKLRFEPGWGHMHPIATDEAMSRLTRFIVSGEDPANSHYE